MLSIDKSQAELRMAEAGKKTEFYWCVVGHEIAQEQLDVETEVRTLDQGAEVRICVEHGAPIAVTKEGMNRS
jgi:hypothetical protein